ncbi:MAG: hypothetical protein A2Z21_10375 [Candidatus Fraserbacteria bacterium RBG_16_55_9]|uniref:Steroid 5-alpha reductase C-terminal domain-containing protein n=1 Tax=Fraserbacteria sp. (strain RBG_16_55_9) TaxID=1817864 RepID=A0A1F5URS5_FRAXR|nr:MAG: hypothetical protein A2Z21_10375 [Candidatus Fraserbacteria bacterium RBG_16_55_9]
MGLQYLTPEIMNREVLHIGVFAVIVLCWLAFGGIFLFRKKPPQTSERMRDRRSVVGIGLQGLSYPFVWLIRRERFTSIMPLSPSIELALAVMTVALGVVSVWMIWSAVRALGKQWSLAARVVEDHKLVMEGPYRFVRHPIYTGMLGLLLATGLSLSYWSILLLAVIVFGIGTAVRVHSEEKLLQGAFGSDWNAYVRRVPAILPLWPRLR